MFKNISWTKHWTFLKYLPFDCCCCWLLLLLYCCFSWWSQVLSELCRVKLCISDQTSYCSRSRPAACSCSVMQTHTESHSLLSSLTLRLGWWYSSTQCAARGRVKLCEAVVVHNTAVHLSAAPAQHQTHKLSSTDAALFVEQWQTSEKSNQQVFLEILHQLVWINISRNRWIRIIRSLPVCLHCCSCCTPLTPTLVRISQNLNKLKNLLFQTLFIW